MVGVDLCPCLGNELLQCSQEFWCRTVRAPWQCIECGKILGAPSAPVPVQGDKLYKVAKPEKKDLIKL